MTLVAALIAAAAALAVVLIDRIVAAQRDETRRQREYRRGVYARFLAARRLVAFGKNLGGDRSAAIAADLALVLSEIELVAPQAVIDAGEDVLRTVADDDATQQQREEARGAFIDLARADIGSTPLPQDVG